MNHPYIGLTGTIRGWPLAGVAADRHDYRGVVVAVFQGGSTTEDGSVGYCAVCVLRDVPDDDGHVHDECDMYRFIPDDPAEARRRLMEAK